jgi:hypothetical protein
MRTMKYTKPPKFKIEININGVIKTAVLDKIPTVKHRLLAYKELENAKITNPWKLFTLYLHGYEKLEYTILPIQKNNELQDYSDKFKFNNMETL